MFCSFLCRKNQPSRGFLASRRRPCPNFEFFCFWRLTNSLSLSLSVTDILIFLLNTWITECYWSLLLQFYSSFTKKKKSIMYNNLCESYFIMVLSSWSSVFWGYSTCWTATLCILTVYLNWALRNNVLCVLSYNKGLSYGAAVSLVCLVLLPLSVLMSLLSHTVTGRFLSYRATTHSDSAGGFSSPHRRQLCVCVCLSAERFSFLSQQISSRSLLPFSPHVSFPEAGETVCCIQAATSISCRILCRFL